MGEPMELERETAQLVAYLRGELGYPGQASGAMRRQIEEHDAMIRNFEEVLRGRGDELGLVGWVMVMRRSWLTIVALVGAAFGYFLNDVVDTLGLRATAARQAATIVHRDSPPREGL